MRLVGGKDYYDSALSYGHDSQLLFVRESARTVADDDVPCTIPTVKFGLTDGKRFHYVIDASASYREIRFKQTYLSFGRLVVLFCGKVFYGVQVYVRQVGDTDSAPLYFWQADKFIEWLSSIDLSLSSGRRTGSTVTAEAMEKLFSSHAATDSLLDWLVLNKVVVAIRRPQPHYIRSALTWEINADRLKDVQFYRRVHATEAFQEIEMWLGGVLPGATNPLAEIDDQTRIAKHGFDHMSFRKPKQGS